MLVKPQVLRRVLDWRWLGALICAAAFVLSLTMVPADAQGRRGEDATLYDQPNRSQGGGTSVQQGNSRGIFDTIFGVRRAPGRRLRSGDLPELRILTPTDPLPELVISIEEKDPNAEVVVVFGDRYADAVADGLIDAYAQIPRVTIDRLVKPRSGLADLSRYDWLTEMESYLLDSRQKIDAAVFAIGLNDRLVPLSDSSGEHAFLSARWQGLYGERIDKIMLALERRGIPAVWVGLPPVADADVSRDFLTMNGMIRVRSESAGAQFIDVWNNFLDENGQYSAIGPDLEGQHRDLRRRDGVGFTRAGARKLGHFVERGLKRLLRPDGFELAIPQQTRMSLAEILAAERATGIGRITALNVGGPSAVAELAGDTSGTQVDIVGARGEVANTSVEALLVDGSAVVERAGRANDFRWPPEARADEGVSGADFEADLAPTTSAVTQ